MTRIDFYILPDINPRSRLPFACRLIDKAYRLGHKVFIQAAEADAYEMDELLWQHQPESFLPHNLLGEGPNTSPPIQIGYGQSSGNHRDVLVNLTGSVPTFYNQFNRVAEIVTQDDTTKQASRINFKYYRAQGHSPHSHDLSGNESN